MRIMINGIEKNFPSSLWEITLGQMIEYLEKYGNGFDERLTLIESMVDGMDRDILIAELEYDQMIAGFAYFTDCEEDAIRDSQFIDNVAKIYYSCLSVISQEEAGLTLQQEFIWNGEEWIIEGPVAEDNKMKFGQFLNAKALIKNMTAFANGNWQSMLPLCGMYLRKKSEPYIDEFLYDGSERIELLKKIPIMMVMQVGLYLKDTTQLFIDSETEIKGDDQQLSSNYN